MLFRRKKISGQGCRENSKVELFTLKSFLRQFAACQKHDTFERLDRIPQPCLIMTGDDDPLVPPENSRILKEMIPQSRLEFFPDGNSAPQA